MAGKQPKPFLLSVDLTAYQYGDAAKLVRGLLNLNERVTLDELKQALTEQNVYVFSWHMPPQLSGVSYRENFAAIFVNAGQTPERQLFTLTHEAVHLICHLRPCPPGDEDKKNASVSLASARSDPQEKEANRLSAEILMPAPLVEHLWKETGARVGDGRKRSFYLGMLARFFNVSRDAMFYRLAELGRLAWSDKKKFVGQFVSDAWETQPRVREIKDQVAPELLTLGLELYGSDEVTAGKLAEWFATSRRRVEEYLSDIEREESSSAELAADFEE
jgi:Zn-dependent peptidase ImmA (M78 family)